MRNARGRWAHLHALLWLFVLLPNPLSAQEADASSSIGWGIRPAIIPLKLAFHQPDYESINRFNRAMGIAPFTNQTLVTYGSEAGLYLGDRIQLTVGVDSGRLRKASIREGQFREIALELRRGEFRIELLDQYGPVEWSVGLFAALADLSLRSKLQTTDGGPVTQPIAKLDANLLFYGPKIGAAYWINPHLNLALSLTQTSAQQYNQTSPSAADSAAQPRILSLEYSEVGVALATTVRF